VLVNPELLRAFASQVDNAAAEISGLDVGKVASTAADGLPGSDTQWAARLVGEHLGSVATDIVSDIGAVGRAVRGAGDRYEVDDATLAGDFKGLF
jgi:hypothetical protein